MPSEINHSRGNKTLVFDVGGTAVKTCVAEQSAWKQELASFPPLFEWGQPQTHPYLNVNPNSKPSLRHVQHIVERAMKQHVRDDANFGEKLEAIGISTTGIVNYRNGTITKSTNIEQYAGFSWEQWLHENLPRWGVNPPKRVAVMNDGHASTWGEYTHKTLAGKPAGSHVHFTLGTGVGGGCVVAGRLLIGEGGEAGYVGRIDSEASQRHLVSKLRNVYSHAGFPTDDFPADLRTFFSSPPPNMTEEHIREALLPAVEYLAEGVAATVNIINPRRVTLGGGTTLALQTRPGTAEWFLGTLSDMVLHKTHSETAKTLTEHGSPVEWGRWGNTAGLRGVASAVATSNFDGCIC